MQNRIDILTKENTELKTKLASYEALQKQCIDTIGGCANWFTAIFTQPQAQK